MYDKSVNLGKKGIIICSLNLKNIYCNLVYVGEKGMAKKVKVKKVKVKEV